MFKYLLVIYLVVSSLDVFAQLDSINRKYFIIFKSNYKSYILEEGRSLVVVDKNDKKSKGFLHVVSDSSIAIESKDSKIDTFNLKDIKTVRIKNARMYINYVSAAFMVGCSIGFYYIAYLFYEDGEIPELGNFFVVIGTVGLTMPVIAHYSLNKNYKSYDFKTFTAKGFKLKRKHLRDLFYKS